MGRLEDIRKKKTKIIAGIMSGTSADGIDTVLVEVRGHGLNSRVRQLAFRTFRYPAGLRAMLMKNSDSRTARLDDIARLDTLLAALFADAVKALARSAGIPPANIDLIGSHGQTVRHLPEPERMFGRAIRSTLQIGNPSILAKLTGVVTVGNFRSGDIALGGTGAPLVPWYDFIMLRSRRKTRGALNIGGIANITLLPRNCTVDEVTAFDTGPGNMIIDGLTERLYRRPYDRGGAIAAGGKIIPSLLRRMMNDPYFGVRPPKSTGRERFGEPYIHRILRHRGSYRNQDLVATATEFTALSVFSQYLRFLARRWPLQELLVSGGGSHNMYLLDALRRYFTGVSVTTTASSGIPVDAKEAICFALLANETLHEHPGNIPHATGARRATVLGAICPP
jgi:anhydro-N-acetylmuramic acid kinase